MTDVSYTQGDTVPLEATLPIEDDEDLADAQHVRFHMNDNSGNVIDDDAQIADSANGVVHYEWKPGETDESGIFEIEWEVLWDNGDIETFPKDEPDTIVFRGELN